MSVLVDMCCVEMSPLSFLAKSAHEEPSAVGLPRLLPLLPVKSAPWIPSKMSTGLRWKCLTPERLGCFVRAFDSGLRKAMGLPARIRHGKCNEMYRGRV